jgi:hypothetical protein
MEGKMLMVPNLRLVEPNNIYRKVPTRRPNAEMRTREYLEELAQRAASAARYCRDERVGSHPVMGAS